MDQLHKLSTASEEEYGAISICSMDVSALAMACDAKSVLDARSRMFGTMRRRCDCSDVWFDEVKEAYSTRPAVAVTGALVRRAGKVLEYENGRAAGVVRIVIAHQGGSEYSRGGTSLPYKESQPFPRPVR